MDSQVQLLGQASVEQAHWEAPELVESEVLEATLANVSANSDGVTGS